MAADSSLTHGHKSALKARNRAFFSIIGVFAGAWLMFRALAPKHGAYVLSDEEREVYKGGPGETVNRTARAPRSLEKT